MRALLQTLPMLQSIHVDEETDCAWRSLHKSAVSVWVAFLPPLPHLIRSPACRRLEDFQSCQDLPKERIEVSIAYRRTSCL